MCIFYTQNMLRHFVWLHSPVSYSHVFEFQFTHAHHTTYCAASGCMWFRSIGLGFGEAHAGAEQLPDCLCVCGVSEARLVSRKSHCIPFCLQSAHFVLSFFLITTYLMLDESAKLATLSSLYMYKLCDVSKFIAECSFRFGWETCVGTFLFHLHRIWPMLLSFYIESSTSYIYVEWSLS